MKTLLLMLLSLLCSVNSMSPKNTTNKWWDEYFKKEIEIEKRVKEIKVPNIKLTYEFKRGLIEMSDSLNINTSYLLAVFHVETIGSFSTSKKSPIGATGLIQFTGSTANWLGTNTRELAQMSPSEQLFYVAKYLDKMIKYYGPLTSLDDVFMAVHYPIAIRKGKYSIVYRSGNAAYNANKFNDKDRNGNVTKYEICNFVQKIYNKYYADIAIRES